jgi:hypothetical protein
LGLQRGERLFAGRVRIDLDPHPGELTVAVLFYGDDNIGSRGKINLPGPREVLNEIEVVKCLARVVRGVGHGDNRVPDLIVAEGALLPNSDCLLDLLAIGARTLAGVDDRLVEALDRRLVFSGRAAPVGHQPYACADRRPHCGGADVESLGRFTRLIKRAGHILSSLATFVAERTKGPGCAIDGPEFDGMDFKGHRGRPCAAVRCPLFADGTSEEMG